MLQRTPNSPKLQLTPAQIMALMHASRVPLTGRYGPKPYKGIPSGYQLTFFGQFADRIHHRRAGSYAAGDARTELVTYKSPIMLLIDTRPKEHRPPYSRKREMARRVRQMERRVK